MRTAVISDLHLGSASREDVLRDPEVRSALFEPLASADRLVLLGDSVELRDFPLALALEEARPFFEELGEAMAGREVLMVPGNHDHRLAEPLLEQHSLDGAGQRPLGLENRYAPAGGAAARIAAWLGPARLEMSYPGVWLTSEVYAMHGHYMDVHLTLPKVEAIGAAALTRALGRLPDPAAPQDYERLLAPMYGLIYDFAQTRGHRKVGAPRPSERVWKLATGGAGSGSRRARLASTAISRGAVPLAVGALNLLLGTGYESDLSAPAVSRAGVRGAAEAAQRMRIGAEHVVVGHSHRAGPREDEGPWRIEGGGSLHNTGNWVFASALHPLRSRPGPYWPGTVTWVEPGLAPHRELLLADRSAEELAAIGGGSAGRFRLYSLASREES